MGINPCFNDIEYFELIWKHERMMEQRRKENEAKQKQQGGKSITEMLGGGNFSG